jgi:hypothetical protein
MGVTLVEASDRGPMAQVMGRAAVTIQRLSAASLAFSGRVNSTLIWATDRDEAWLPDQQYDQADA